jgi:hypothetical protein
MTDREHENHQAFEAYEIRIEGHLEDRWEDWFEGLTMQKEARGTTLLSGNLPDQTALHSVLLRIRNMNLKIISIRQMEDHKQEAQDERRKGNDV